MNKLASSARWHRLELGLIALPRSTTEREGVIGYPRGFVSVRFSQMGCLARPTSRERNTFITNPGKDQRIRMLSVTRDVHRAAVWFLKPLVPDKTGSPISPERDHGCMPDITTSESRRRFLRTTSELKFHQPGVIVNGPRVLDCECIRCWLLFRSSPNGGLVAVNTLTPKTHQDYARSSDGRRCDRRTSGFVWSVGSVTISSSSSLFRQDTGGRRPRREDRHW